MTASYIAATDSSPSSTGEKRAAPRVTAGRPGRLRIVHEDEEFSLPCGLVDLSRSGCRLTLPAKSFPPGWESVSGAPCAITFRLNAVQEYAVAAEVVWCQVTREGFQVLGCRFADHDEDTEAIDRFVMIRLRAGLTDDPPSSPTADASACEPLETPLEVEARDPNRPGFPGARYRLIALGEERMELQASPREGEAQGIPATGEVLNLTVAPPSWARGQRRTLRFAARVLQADAQSAVLTFYASGSDLAQMVRSLIPDKIEYVPPPTQVDVHIVLLILAVIVIALLMITLQEIV